LRQENKEQHPSGYLYSQFCELFRTWKKKLDLSMRQKHLAGEKLFVDYCGQTVPIVDASTCEICDAQMFVAVMGASNYTYADATWTQSLADWTGSHVTEHSPFLAACPSAPSLIIYAPPYPKPAAMNLRSIRPMPSWQITMGSRLFQPGYANQKTRPRPRSVFRLSSASFSPGCANEPYSP